MKKRDLKQRLTDAFAHETPNLCDSILASCKQEEQLPADAPADTPASPRPSLLDKFLSWQLPLRRVAAAALCLVLFLVCVLIKLLVTRVLCLLSFSVVVLIWMVLVLRW